MKQKIVVDNVGNIVLTDKEYIASGGEGTVYRVRNMAIKIYHDVSKMMPLKKINELSVLNMTNVLAPQNIVRDENGNPIGYSSAYVDNTHPLCKLFTNGFRKTKNFDDKKTVNLVRLQQETVVKIHQNNVLIVDLNEMNFLVNNSCDIVYFIDVDSYQTENFKATALMESVRDRKVKNNQFTTLSDWYSFAIVAFQLYVGVHPYKGLHPDYAVGEWMKRMDDGVSVFDKKAKLPPTARPLSVIPKSHFQWFEDVFKNGNRSVPPLPGNTPVVIQKNIQPIIIKSTDGFIIDEILKCYIGIYDMFVYGSNKYVATVGGVHKLSPFQKKIEILSDAKISKKNFDHHIGICSYDGMDIYVEKNKDGLLCMREIDGQVIKPDFDFYVNDFTIRDGRLYIVFGDKFSEVSFIKTNNKTLVGQTPLCSIMGNTCKVYNGVIYNDILGVPFIGIPYGKGKVFFKEIPEMKNYRIIDMKSEGEVVVVLAEKKGEYYRFVLVFDGGFTKYNVRVLKTDDMNISFTKIKGGPCISLENDTMEIFLDNSKVKRIENCPINSSMDLLTINGKVHFIDDDRLFSITMK